MDPNVNAAGREVWFVQAGDGGGAYRPVHRRGLIAFVLAALWLLACAGVCMAGFVVTLDPRWFVAMFVAGAIGLGSFAWLVARHS